MMEKNKFRVVERGAFKIDWVPFFAPGTEVMALPGWGAPRLFVSAECLMQRWRQSAFYPAYRPRARALRLGLRVWAAAGLAPGKLTPAHEWTLGTFVHKALPSVASVSVRPGWPGPEQKITVQCRDAEGHVVGYLKYAEQAQARARLHREREVLSRLPERFGPALIKYGLWHKGEALLTRPLRGRTMPTTLPPSGDVVAFVQRLVVGSERFAMSEHPWVRGTERPPALTPALDALRSRPWPRAIQHGDLTPWNIHRSPEGTLYAFDWEHGTTEGFPYLDLAHYVLQVAGPVNYWTPGKASTYATDYLARRSGLPLTQREAQALVRLAAYDAYRMALEDGHQESADLQQFRRAIWENGR